MQNDPITSDANRWIKRARRAAERHKEEILVEGPKQIGDALSAGLEPIAVLVRENREPPSGLDPRITHPVATHVFRNLGDTATSQGIVALFEHPRMQPRSIIECDGPILVLDGIQDPGNVGAIVRLAVAFHAAGVIALSGTADPYSPRAIRGSAGTVLLIPVATCSPDELIDECARSDREVFVAHTDGPSVEKGFPDRPIVVFGSEGSGVRPEIDAIARAFSIPTSGRVESLNVATAAAIVLWELAKGRAG